VSQCQRKLPAAESIAYVAGRHFGLDGFASPNYVALHGADAFAILTHRVRIRETASLIINGREVYYPIHTPEQTAMFLEYAQQHHLLISAGSDSHGADKPPIKYRVELSRTLLERMGIHIA